MKALITDASYLHTLAIVRYLAKESIDTLVIGHNKSLDISRYSKYCKHYLKGPKIEKEKEYVKFLLKTLAREKIDTLIPVSHTATAIASKYKNRINKISKVEVADYDKVKIALNKKSTYQLAEKLGVPYPKTFYPISLKETKKISQNIHYPAVIKWLFEVGNNIVVIVRNGNELVKNYSEICQKYNPPSDSLPMIQEFIPTSNNEVYCLSALYQNNKCKKIFTQKQIRNTPVEGGTCSYAESCYIPQVKIYSLKLLNELNWNGVAHIEFKLDQRDGLFKLMEINPKFWASTDMALKAGINFPYLLCQMARGEKIKHSEEYNRNLKFHFPFSRELKHIKESPKSIFKISIDTINPAVKSNVWLKDLKPNLIELIITINSLFLPRFIKNFIKKINNCNDKNQNSK